MILEPPPRHQDGAPRRARQAPKPLLAALAAVLALTAASPALAAIGYTTAAPARVDAFAGIADRKALNEKIGGPIAGARDLNLAVILSQNTKDQLAWSDKVTVGVTGFDKGFNSMFLGSKAVADADRMMHLAYDPKLVSDSLMLPLAARFKSVKVVGGLSEFSQGGYDLAVVLDVSFVNTYYNSPLLIGDKFETGTTLNAYFVDRSGALIQKVEVTETRSVPVGLFIKSVGEVRTDVLGRYRTGIDAALAPEAAPSQTAAAAAPQSAADRLRALDELVKGGLVTPEEAAQKRAKIIEGL